MTKNFFLAIIFFCATSVAAQSAPDIIYETKESQTATLSELKGKVVYISFWASWCGPCKKNFQKYYELRQTLAEEGTVLLNISLDKDKSKWEAALSKYDYINGINGHALNLSEVNADYKISKVPDYHIVNKEGEFVFLSDAPNRNILEEFKKWVDE